MSQPYQGADDGYRGYPIHSDAAVRDFMAAALEDDVQILAHCNGDAAAQQMLDAYAAAVKKTGRGGIRPVMIHAQLLRADQLPQLAELGMFASFFVAHTWQWGDIHIENFGMPRAARISPVGSALRAGVPYTFHQDTPVLPPDMLSANVLIALSAAAPEFRSVALADLPASAIWFPRARLLFLM